MSIARPMIPALLRLGLRFPTWTEAGEAGGALILSDGTLVEETHRHVARNAISLASRPGSTVGSRAGTPSPGSGGVHAVSGDSLYFYADAHHGRVRWSLVDEEGLRPLRERDLGWEPVEYDIDLDEARRAEAEAWGVPVSELELRTPQYVGKLFEARVVIADNGDAWLQRRTWTSARPERFREERILVPFDPDDPVREVALPENFLLSDVSGNHLLGTHMDPTTGEESVHLYRFTPEVD